MDACSEPEARKARREAIRGTEEDEALKARTRERRCKRYPVPADDRPPLTRAIGTHVGVVFFIGTDGELVDPATMSAFYFPMNEGGEYVWASWRPGALEELVTTWPARTHRDKTNSTGLVDADAGGTAKCATRRQIQAARQAAPGWKGLIR